VRVFVFGTDLSVVKVLSMSNARHLVSRVSLVTIPAFLILALAVAPRSGASADDAAARVPTPTSVLSLPSVVRAADGKRTDIAGVAGTRATVLIFVSTNCPISNRYAPEMAALTDAYRARGVAVALVYANAGIERAAVLRHARAYGLTGVGLFLDPAQALADAVGATVTPETFLLDAGQTVRYHGRIDDRFAERGQPRVSGVTTHDLRTALDAVLAGRPVAVTSTPAVGCVIERADKRLPDAPTYADVAPILQRNCQSCHRAGEIGPMTLEGYADAKRWAANIAAVTGAKVMPPWKPVAGHGEFIGERRLTETQIATLRKWADAGAPQGDPANVPPPPTFPHGWQLGTPDLVLTMPEKWQVPADSRDVYRCFVLPTNLKADKDVVAVEYRAGNKGVVHHILGFIDDSGRAREKDAQDAGPGYTSFGSPGFLPTGSLGGWAPGNLPQFLPDGVGRPLPAGSDVVLQVHYHADGKPEEDITSVGLYFAKKPVSRKFRMLPLIVRNLDIPAGDSSYTVTRTTTVPIDATVLTVTPHIHLLGHTFEMTATLPDGTVKPMVRIDNWDFKWQDTYTYKEPFRLPRGTTVTLTAGYDNSASNPRNPNSPPKRVTWGEETTDEMCIGFVGFIADDENAPLIRLMDGLQKRQKAEGGAPRERPSR
jgi:hypothetical protein